MSFMIKEDDIFIQYSEVWEFDGVIKTNFLRDKIAKENVHYTCIPCITIDSVMRMKKKKLKIHNEDDKND